MPAAPYRPPFAVTSEVLATSAEVMRLVGRLEGLSSPAPQPKLRRQNRIRTVVGSVAIEGNTLTFDQATALLDDKRVVGSKREILEVQNALAAYATASAFNPNRERDLLRAHGILMKGLATDAGRYRNQGVGVFQGTALAHMAPPAKRVPALVGQLLEFVARDPTPDLFKAAVAHYELEFIHPFSDGNGRVGRLWQHVILVKAHPVFEHVPVESIIHARQRDYYRVLGECDAAGDASAFVGFALTAIHDALAEFVRELRPEPIDATGRLEAFRAMAGAQADFSRQDYRAHWKTLSTATASRDLKAGVEQKLLLRQGDKSRARYRFARRA